MPPKKTIRLVHTSDTHLGDDLGHPASEEALQAVVDAVAGLGADALLLAGDVFDNERVSDRVLRFFLEEMGRLAVPAVVLPGNHDPYDEGSVYCRQAFARKPPNLHLFTRPEGETISFPELTLDLWGRAMRVHAPEFRPLAGMPPRADGHWLVALAHGHFQVESGFEGRSSPIFADEVAGAPCDYLALGHWDRHVEVSQGRVKAAYSGTPVGYSRDSPVMGVAVVDLDPLTGVKIRRVSLAAWAGRNGSSGSHPETTQGGKP